MNLLGHHLRNTAPLMGKAQPPSSRLPNISTGNQSGAVDSLHLL